MIRNKDNISDGINIFLDMHKTDFLRPPFTIKKDIITEYRDICDRYLKFLESHISEMNNGFARKLSRRLEKTKIISIGITECLQHFLSGDIKTAYDSFDSIFNDTTISKYIQNISIPLNEICNKMTPLFRVRKSDSPLITREEMFHIPFKLRHLVNAQRYSVAGLPCLYLGSSLYICWQEMDKPDFNKLYLSSFSSNDDNAKVLNFASDILFGKLRALHIPKHLQYSEISIITQLSYLTLYPLIIACSFIKKAKNASFNQEYIIPNLLMQWISRRNRSNVMGIAYRSTKLKRTTQNKRSINVVLPPKITYSQTLSHDFCPKLSSMFELTQPISWQVLKTLDYDVIDNEDSARQQAIHKLKRREHFYGIENFDEELFDSFYPLTDFFKLENSIDKLFEYSFLDGDRMAAED